MEKVREKQAENCTMGTLFAKVCRPHTLGRPIPETMEDTYTNFDMVDLVPEA